MQGASRGAWVLAGLALAALAHAQGGPDELWDMTTRMEMAGMPAQAMSQQVCMKKGQTRAEGFSQDKNCKVTEQRTVGNKLTWKVVCSGADAMTGTGEMTRSGDNMSGRVRMQGKSGGEPMDMTMVYSGKRAGGCTWEDPSKVAAAYTAQANAALDQQCRESMDKYLTVMFEGQSAPCKAQKAEYCGRVAKAAQSMRKPAGYRNAMKNDGLRRGGFEQAGQACGVDAAAVLGDACKGATGSRDWPFVADYCPAEARALAAEHCAGRKYTVAMASEYKAVCQRYASGDSGGDDGAAAQSRSQSQSPAQSGRDAQQKDASGAPAAPSPADLVKDGANKLRSLFGR